MYGTRPGESDTSLATRKKPERWRALAMGAAVAGSIIGCASTAFAGSDNSSDTYAGDVNGIALPAGTFLAIEYLGWRDSNTYVTTGNNIFTKTGVSGGKKDVDGNLDLLTSITRFSYFTRLWDHPLVLEAAFTVAKVEGDANVGPEPLTSADGLTDPVLFISYGLINAPKEERFLALTNYVYLPGGRSYQKFEGINVTTPNQTTWVPQVAYAEGLGKFGLQNLWLDIIANASIHSDGGAPLAVETIFGPAQFDNLSQDNSYDIKAFLRYVFGPANFLAVGVEKSWGGDQIASGGGLGLAFGPTSLGKDDFLKGHVQFAFPLAADFHVDTDFTHDFEREGGFKEDFTGEVRFTKFFLPTAPLK